MHVTRLSLALLLMFASAAPLCAQRNAAHDLLDSPIKIDQPRYHVGEVIRCSLFLGADPALFAVDTIPGTSPTEIITTDLLSTFEVFRLDQSCNIVSSWQTAMPSGTVFATGTTVDPSGATYWSISQDNDRIDEYSLPGGTPTGTTIALPSGQVWGPAVIDRNQPGKLLYIEDIASDIVVEIDLLAGGAVGCSFVNPDNTGSGAFGNGLGVAEFPADCSDATLVISSGAISEGQVTRVGQTDCSGTLCRDTWDVSFVSTFVNGIAELSTSGERALALADNASTTFMILNTVFDSFIDCQSSDPGADILYVNGSRGSFFGRVPIDSNAPLTTALQRIDGSNGRFVFHLNSGEPTFGTVGPLLDLGNSCFPFVGGSPSIVANNVGKTAQVGGSSYFGSGTPDPARAPVFIDPTQAAIDAANLPAGSRWTGQAVALNPAASSIKGASLTNPIVYAVD